MEKQENKPKLRADLTPAEREKAERIGRIDFQSAGATRKHFDYVARKAWRNDQ